MASIRMRTQEWKRRAIRAKRVSEIVAAQDLRPLEGETRGNRVPGWEHIDMGRLSEAVGIHRATLCGLITGRRSGRINTYVGIAKACGLTWTQLWEQIEVARRKDINRLKQGRMLIEAKIQAMEAEAPPPIT